jgi:hypothetical protein
MKYSIIFKYIGEDIESKREFDLNNIDRDLNFDNLIDFKDNKSYIKNEGGVYFNNVIYTIHKDYLDTMGDEIICVFGLESESESLRRDAEKRAHMYSDLLFNK